MDKPSKSLIEKYYTSRSLSGFSNGIISDIQDLLSDSYTVDRLKQDFDGWCERNKLGKYESKKSYYDYTSNVPQFLDK